MRKPRINIVSQNAPIKELQRVKSEFTKFSLKISLFFTVCTLISLIIWHTTEIEVLYTTNYHIQEIIFVICIINCGIGIKYKLREKNEKTRENKSNVNIIYKTMTSTIYQSFSSITLLLTQNEALIQFHGVLILLLTLISISKQRTSFYLAWLLTLPHIVIYILATIYTIPQTHMLYGIIILTIYLISNKSASRAKKLITIKNKLRTNAENIKFLKDSIPMPIIAYNPITQEYHLNKAAKQFRLLKLKYIEIQELLRASMSVNPPKISLFEQIEKKHQYFNKSTLNYLNIEGKYLFESELPKSAQTPKENSFFKRDNTNNIKNQNLNVIKTKLDLKLFWRKSWGEEMIIIIDLMEKEQKLRDEKTTNRFKNVVLGTLCHDLKTPLNGIIGVIDDMSETSKSTKEFKIMKMSSQILLYKVHDMLDYSHIESNEFIPQPKRFELPGLMWEVFEIAQIQAELEGKYIRCEPDANLPNYIRADPLRIKQVLLHLVLNGLKYSTEGRSVIIYARKEEKIVELGVRDEGIGISLEKQAALNKLFIGNTLPKEFSNLIQIGFGLSITSKIVGALGSKLKFLSTPGEGALFYFQLEIQKSSFFQRRQTQMSLTNPMDKSPTSPISPIPTKELQERYPLTARPQKIRHHSLEKRNKIGRTAGGFEEFKFGNCWIIEEEGQKDEEENKTPQSNQSKDSFEVTGEHPFEQTEESGEIGETSPSQQMSVHTSPQKKASGTLLSTFSALSVPTLPTKPILLVEDNGANRFVAKGMLERMHMKVIEATNGREAITAVEESVGEGNTAPFSFILMDLNMPVMDGFQATDALSRMMRGGKVAKMPILALTAFESGELREKCLRKGFAGFYEKPITKPIMMRIVQTYARERKFS